MLIRAFNDSDYEIVSEWWVKQGWPSLPIELLPDIGIVIENDGDMCCVGWLYTSNSEMAWLGWPVANPDVPAFSRGRAVLKMIEAMEVMAKKLGFSALMTFSKVPAMMKAYEQKDWHIGETTMEIMKRF